LGFTKKNGGSSTAHFFQDNLNVNKNADISIFLKKKEGKDYFSTIALEFALT